MTITRRGLMAGSAAGVGIAVTGSLPALTQAIPAGAAAQTRHPAPFGPLVDDPNKILALPEGFSYTVVSETGSTKLTTGENAPGRPDGTAVFGKGKRQYLIVNHECGAGDAVGVPHVPGTVYDPGAVHAGGCTVISTDGSGNNLGQSVAISGTVSNCAGGPTPWGTWWTCEETTVRAGASWSNAGATGKYEKDHGYVFEVYGDGTANPVPLKALGRFAHEAIAISENRRAVYLSEDASGPNGLFYRWTGPGGYQAGPNSVAQLSSKDFGTLSAMAILLDDGSVLPDVAYLTSAQLGRPFQVAWVPVPERDAASTDVRKQFAAGQVTRGRKFEGVWGTKGGVYIVNSYAFKKGSDLPTDATPHAGLVWFYDYAEETIELVTYFPTQAYAEAGGVEPAFPDLTFDSPDNVSVTPWGSLILAEDGIGASHVLSSTPGGPTYAIARNMMNIGGGTPEYSEFTGPTFDAAGSLLYVNIQDPGVTLAISGPWKSYLG